MLRLRPRVLDGLRRTTLVPCSRHQIDQRVAPRPAGFIIVDSIFFSRHERPWFELRSAIERRENVPHCVRGPPPRSSIAILKPSSQFRRRGSARSAWPRSSDVALGDLEARTAMATFIKGRRERRRQAACRKQIEQVGRLMNHDAGVAACDCRISFRGMWPTARPSCRDALRAVRRVLRIRTGDVVANLVGRAEQRLSLIRNAAGRRCRVNDRWEVAIGEGPAMQTTRPPPR